MRKRLTIRIDESVYDALHETVGRRYISQFIESLVRPHVLKEDMAAGYKALADDEALAAESLEWVEATTGDIAFETR